MNDDSLIPHIPNYQNPLQQLVNRMDAQDELNRNLAGVLTRLTESVHTISELQAQHAKQLLTIAQWIEKQQK